MGNQIKEEPSYVESPFFAIKDEMSKFFDEIGKKESKRIKIHIVTLFGESFYLDVEPSTSIKMIKNKIRNILGIPSNCQRLFFRCAELNNNDTLNNLDINDSDSFRLVKRINPKEEDEEEEEQEGEEQEQEQECKQFTEQEELENFEAEQEEEEEEEQIINHNEIDKINISIAYLNYWKMNLTVYTTNTIRDIKYIIQGKKGIDAGLQKLIFGGELLENKRTLKYYQIGNNKLISLALINKKDSLDKKGTELEKNNNINMEKKRKINENDKIHINVETISGKKIDLDITEDYEIKQIKNIIQEKEGINVEQQMIFFEGFELDDRKSLKYYKIHDEFILYLLLKRNKDNKENNKIQMLIKSMDGRKLNLEVDSRTIIKEIKYKIQDKEGIPFSKQ